MKKLFGNPRTRIRNMLLLILPFVVAMGVFGFVTYTSASELISGATGESTAESSKDIIESMNYHLRKNPTDYQQELFNELKEAVEDGSDKSLIADLVVKNFVADFYTWTNKDGSYDVGGMYYVYGKSKGVIYAQARNTFYKYLTYYANYFGQDDLLEVISIENEPAVLETYEYDGKSYTSYYITSRWEYAESESFPVGRYCTKEYFIVIENEGRFEIAQAFGDE